MDIKAIVTIWKDWHVKLKVPPFLSDYILFSAMLQLLYLTLKQSVGFWRACLIMRIFWFIWLKYWETQIHLFRKKQAWNQQHKPAV